MAIDPKLVSIKTAGELPVSDPSDSANFLFYEGEELKRSPMANIYDKVSSGLLPATTSTVPSTTGFDRYLIRTAGTYTNFKDSGNAAIVVTAADLDVVSGVANNRVILEVQDGVAKKIVERVKGDAGAAGSVPTVQTLGTSTVNVMSQDAVTKEFTNLDKFATERLSNLVVNGNFAGNTTGWTILSNTTVTQEAEGVKILSTAATWGEIRQTVTNLKAGNIVYLTSKFKSENSNYRISLDGEVAPFGDGSWERVSIRKAATASMTIRFRDNNTSGWLPYYVKEVMLIDLTETFGAGKEPTQAEMDAMINKFGWFDASVNLLKKRVALNEISNQINTTPLTKNWNFQDGKRNWTLINATATVANNELTFTGTNTTPDAELFQNITYVSGQVFYATAEVKANSSLVQLVSGGSTKKSHTGSGQFERLSSLITANRNSIVDRRRTGFDAVVVKNFIVLNLTEIFGAGNEPSLTEMDSIMNRFTISGSTFNFNSAILKSVIKDKTNHGYLSNETPKTTKSIDLRVDFLEKKGSHQDYSPLTRTPSQATTGYISLIDDDGKTMTYTDLYPFLKARGIPFASAISPAKTGNSTYMTRDQIVFLKNNGVEIMSHGLNHVGIASNSTDLLSFYSGSGLTPTQMVEREIKESKDELIKIGLNPQALVLPYGVYNAETLRIASRHYDATYHFQNQQQKIQNFTNTRNHELGRYSFDTGNAAMKSRIDNAVAEKGWLIITTHVGYYDWDNTIESGQTMSNSFRNLDELITYALSVGAKFVLPTEGFQIFGNLMEADNGFKINAKGVTTAGI